MAAPVARAALFGDRLLAIMGAIPTAPTGTYRTVPFVAAELGPPPDAIPTDNEGIYVCFAMNELRRPGMENPTAPVGAGMASHHRRVHFYIFVTSTDQREMLQVAADVEQALWADEAGMTGVFAVPAWDGDLIFRDDLSRAGVFVAYYDIFIDLDVSHTAP